MSGNVTRGWCAVVTGVALAASALAASAAAQGAASLRSAAVTARPAAAAGGARLWLARYHNGVATGVAVSGTRVYVTGFSLGATSSTDYATVAYNGATGARLWAKRYNGPANGADDAAAIAVSPGGSRVYVTGYSDAAAGSADYATVAYSAATGAQLWAARYNGPASEDDFPAAIAVSPDGARVYVTGSSAEAKLDRDDYATVAYSAATGARLWAARYNDPGSGYDTGNAIAVSPGGNRVYVTGRSQGAKATDDYATVAYSAATGAGLWTKRYNGSGKGYDIAYAVAVSPDGNRVYVTGASQHAASRWDDYATVAYSAATGARLWAKRYNGPANSLDIPTALAVSPDGSTVYVTGGSSGTTSAFDYATVAYSAATGAQLWAARYNGPGNSEDQANAVAVSPDGTRVYVTGSSQEKVTPLSPQDYATVAYSAGTGAVLWVRRYQGPDNRNDLAGAVAVSLAGTRVYVTGSSQKGNGASTNYVTVAYQG